MGGGSARARTWLFCEECCLVGGVETIGGWHRAKGS